MSCAVFVMPCDATRECMFPCHLQATHVLLLVVEWHRMGALIPLRDPLLQRHKSMMLAAKPLVRDYSAIMRARRDKMRQQQEGECMCMCMAEDVHDMGSVMGHV